MAHHGEGLSRRSSRWIRTGNSLHAEVENASAKKLAKFAEPQSCNQLPIGHDQRHTHELQPPLFPQISIRPGDGPPLGPGLRAKTGARGSEGDPDPTVTYAALLTQVLRFGSGAGETRAQGGSHIAVISENRVQWGLSYLTLHVPSTMSWSRSTGTWPSTRS